MSRFIELNVVPLDGSEDTLRVSVSVDVIIMVHDLNSVKDIPVPASANASVLMLRDDVDDPWFTKETYEDIMLKISQLS